MTDAADRLGAEVKRLEKQRAVFDDIAKDITGAIRYLLSEPKGGSVAHDQRTAPEDCRLTPEASGAGQVRFPAPEGDPDAGWSAANPFGPVPSLLALIDAAAEEVFTCPRSWGGRYALEPLVVMLCVLHAQVRYPFVARRAVIERYVFLLARRTSGGSGDLRSRLGPDCSVEDMIAVLREQFRDLKEWDGATSDS